jgi:hypothetical protein
MINYEGYMKYSIYINQVGIIQAKLLEQTDFKDWAIIDYLKDWYFSGYSKKISVTEEDKHIDYVWVNYNHLIESMPMLKFDKNDLSLRFKKLKKLGLIKTHQTKDNTLYFILTEKCVDICFYKENIPPISQNHDSLYPKIVTAPVSQNRDSTIRISYQLENNNSIYCCNNVSSSSNNVPNGDASNIEASINPLISKRKKVSNNGNKVTNDENKVTKIKGLLQNMSAAFERRFGERMFIDWGKDSKIIKNLLSIYDADKLKELWDIFLDSNDQFVLKAGKTIGVFKTQINRLLMKKKTKNNENELLEKITKAMEEHYGK